MPPPPSSNISRFAADIIVGSAEMPESAFGSGSSGAIAAATASSAPAPSANAAIAARNRASDSDAALLLPGPPASFAFLSRPPNPRPPLALRAWRSSLAAASRERSARTRASISPITSRMRSRRAALNVPPPSSPET